MRASEAGADPVKHPYKSDSTPTSGTRKYPFWQKFRTRRLEELRRTHLRKRVRAGKGPINACEPRGAAPCAAVASLELFGKTMRSIALPGLACSQTRCHGQSHFRYIRA